MRQLGTQAGVDDAALAARLELGLEDPDPLVRGCAVHGLLHLHPDDVGAMLLARPGAESAERAVLTSLVARRAEDPLLQMHLVEQSCAAARGTADPGTRAHAAGSCAIGSLAAAEEFSRDPSWIVRARVVEALFSGDGPLTADQREALIGRFGDDPHPTVRRLVRAARGEGRQVRPGDLDPDRMAR